MDCGCETRSQTLGIDHEQAMNIALFTGSALLILSTVGGNVSAKTHKMLGIALFGAVSALVVDGVVKPLLKP